MKENSQEEYIEILENENERLNQVINTLIDVLVLYKIDWEATK